MTHSGLAERKDGGSRPVSRVLSRTAIPLVCTSPHTSSNLPESDTRAAPKLSYLVLLRVGFAVPFVLPPTRCALTAPFHPYLGCRHPRRYIFCGTFRRLTPPRRYLALCPMEPGLSSTTQRVTATVQPTPRGHTTCQVSPAQGSSRTDI